MVSPASPLAALLAAPEPLGSTWTPRKPFERLLRLPGGRWVSSWSEDWRSACELHEVGASAAPDAELQARAARRSGKDEAVAAQILLALRRDLNAWRDLNAAPDAQVEAAAQAVLALPDKAARRAAVEQVRAAAGLFAAAALEAQVRALWSARAA